MTDKTVLIIGSGGREHTLAWALAHSPQVRQVYVAPGNGGTTWADADGLAPARNVPLGVNETQKLVQFAQEKRIDLTVVGPEAPLVAGMVDAFETAGLQVFGPSQAAAQLEGSKAFAKDFMHQNNIPTAPYQIFKDYETAHNFLEQNTLNWAVPHAMVIKADGLAAGKGVIVCNNLKQAQAALKHIMVQGAFGSAGDTVVIEERLLGQEISILGLSDGQTIIPLTPARDHKRIYDDDKGPNTGGMGAFAPVKDVDEALIKSITQTVLEPTLAAMAQAGMPYKGVLYAGLMLTKSGAKVIEFNCRFGDPEIQAVLPLLQSDLYQILMACIEGNLAQTQMVWSEQTCVNIVMASPGYPGAYYPTGLPITGLDEAAQVENALIFHAGTATPGENVVTAGGRVLGVTGLGPNLDTALATAYQAVERIHFEGAQYRRDIGRTG